MRNSLLTPEVTAGLDTWCGESRAVPLTSVPAPACLDPSESYYEEAQPYEETFNDDGDAVSSSYESYDEKR
ncbi:Actin filament-associated protein 1-like 2 [Dissostichus eleginoides]|uniref:Actin filament-associated protein 1-like 2 n=1 Tax=Dissostichus eleginoides TaxID=100907 RepID=A0AAD9EY33_DISEL|nr:Actin filament-associated protein 1-like 2 [Dissostichus eleginoides]